MGLATGFELQMLTEAVYEKKWDRVNIRHGVVYVCAFIVVRIRRS